MTQQPYERVLFREGDSVDAKRENLRQAYVLKAPLTATLMRNTAIETTSVFQVVDEIIETR